MSEKFGRAARKCEDVIELIDELMDEIETPGQKSRYKDFFYREL